MHTVWIGCLLLWSITLLLHSQCHGASVTCLQPTNSSGHFKQPSPVLNCSGQHKTSNTNCKCNGETLLLCSCASNGVTYYVRPPNSTTSCPSEPCHVLSYYAQHNTFNTSNARFVFLPGNHTLNTTIVIENVQNVALTGDDRFENGLLSPPAPSSRICCHSDRALGSSDHIGVCFCTNDIPAECKNKKNRERNITVYPGQTFNVSAIMVGQRGGTVTGVIHTNVVNATIDPMQALQAVDSYDTCKSLTYTVFTSAKSVVLHLTGASKAANSPFTARWIARMHVALRECPAGFTLANTTPPICDCAPILKEHHISCDINKGTIHRPASSWIGYYNASYDNETSGVLYYAHCPFDYCRQTDMDIQLNNSDEQCALSHARILCGSCKPGLSLALGTSQCLQCPNAYLTLLIPFGVAGLVLVFLLFLCNLTVAEGTLNGLIFYANIIWVNKAIFFPSNNTNILTVFIAWVNLDLGIQTCFYDGMDAYEKTWLQFAFPLYIWTLVGLIIYLSRYRAVNRLIGKNAVKVLATLFLLSYTKLQRTIIAALSVTSMQYPDNSRRYMWLFDGNMDYFAIKRIPLFVAGLASLLFISLPYTLALFLICYIRRIATPRYRLLRWIVRLLPLFDAYTAPYKPRYQFWTGFLLLVRIVLLPLFTLNYSNDPALNLMATAITCLFVFMLTWSFRAVYKQWPLDVLESSFILNLGSVSVIVLYTGVSQSASAVAYTSTGVAFATFVGIILYHCYKQVSKTGLWRGFRAAARSQLGVGRRGRGDEAEPLLPETDSPEPLSAREGVMPHLSSYNTGDYRESMLAELTDSRD